MSRNYRLLTQKGPPILTVTAGEVRRVGWWPPYTRGALCVSLTLSLIFSRELGPYMINTQYLFSNGRLQRGPMALNSYEMKVGKNGISLMYI
jgi:hypothetical protein